MALRMDRDVRRVTIVKSGTSSGNSSGPQFVYRRRNDNDDEQPIKRVTVIKRDDRGRVLAHDSYGAESQGRRQSRHLRPAEKGIRALMEFQGRVVNNYLARHSRSNEKNRDGWLADMPRNVFRAVKQSKPKKLLKIYRTRD
jgi:hypothetical protein